MNLKCAINKTQFLYVFIFYLFFCLDAFGQKDNINIIPLSPNAAEMTKYGEIPVSNFTGIPNIEVPVYTITSGDLSLPISLSYHGGGNKVESIASWVGLSWSLGTFPSISRSVNGQPDESVSGFFNRIGGKSVKQHYEDLSTGNKAGMENLLITIRDYQGDSEPDAFYLNINGKSCKFFYDQDKQSFVTTSPMNIKIEYSSIGFKVIADDGTIYYLEDKEFTGTSASGPMSSVVTSWQISRIQSADRKSEINFTYAVENQMTSSLISDVRYQVLSGDYCGDLPSQSGGQITSISAKLLSSISFNGGRIDFIRQQTGREDLNGGFALDKIRVYDNTNLLIKEFGFVYKYLSGLANSSGCPINSIYPSNKWLFLTQFRENGLEGSTAIVHSMLYNENNIPPCRNSPAQDAWGYFNGATANQNLIPPIPNPDNPTLLLPGADRLVNPNYSDWGMLKKLVYPNGGYTLFDYENNDANDSSLPASYITETAYLAADDPDETLPTYKEYETTFVINNPPDQHLNGGNSMGGAYINLDMDNLGVPFGNTGALVYIEKISSDLPYAQVYPGGSFQHYYLPNGTYRMKAIFNQNPPNYQNFYCIVTFDKRNNNIINNYTGGIRIKKISSYDSDSATPITKNYSYVDEIGGVHSSGTSFIHPVFKFYDVFMMTNFGAPGGTGCSARVLRARSYSNQTQVTHQGAYVGYKKIFMYSDNIDQTGMTSYEYNHVQDVDYGLFPYAPAQSMESFRGQPKVIEEFKKKNGVFSKVKQTLFEYKDKIFDDESIFAIKTSTEVNSSDFVLPYPYYFPYEILKTWSSVSKKTERVFDSLDETKFTESVIEYTYDEPRYQPLETKVKRSDGSIQSTKNYYPYNLSLVGDAEVARNWMLANNLISSVLKQETSIEGVLSKTKVFNYKNFDGGFMVKPSEIFEKIGASQDPNVTFLNKYNAAGKLTEFHLGSEPKTTYLWGYGFLYPVAKILNAEYNEAVQLVDLNLINNINLTDSQLRSELQKLRIGLPNAQVTSYTYKPLVGMTSTTDPKGITTYYEYDAFQRLKAIKDQNGNILKQTEYHYKN